MDFLNPIALIFALTSMSVNLHQFSDQMATDLSATYVQDSIREDIQTQKCPRTLHIALSASDKPGVFFLRRSTHYSGAPEKLRWIPVDGKTRVLYGGEIIAAKVINPRSVEITLFNENVPNEKVVETMTFQKGSLSYTARYENDRRPHARTLCKGATYTKQS